MDNKSVQRNGIPKCIVYTFGNPIEFCQYDIGRSLPVAMPEREITLYEKW